MLKSNKSITNIVDLNFIKCKKHNIKIIDYLTIYNVNYKYKQNLIKTRLKIKVKTKVIKLLHNNL